METQSTIQIKSDKSKEVVKVMQRQLQNGLLACGTIAEGYAKGDCPVDTGRLRNSINYAVKNKSGQGEGRDIPNANPEEATVYIGSNVEYAAVQEYRDMKHKVGKAHFLRDSVTTHVSEYQKTLEAALKN
jgi:hypothetical protein